jgi:hypothetical protein
LDGLELRKTILTERPGIKVLLMSGYTERPVENIPLLVKPFVAGVLTQRMRELLALLRVTRIDPRRSVPSLLAFGVPDPKVRNAQWITRMVSLIQSRLRRKH